ncbi:MAG: UvrD-helicase domain-containing protein [Deltaproteobacteria bacterium]|nr:UvrD-helicase domain-containing protein [Deltaproteobacteria bacterium]
MPPGSPRSLAGGQAFFADLHIHSRFSRATAKSLAPETLAASAAAKGLSVTGTGDLTHPLWLEELAAKLEPCEGGFYRLKRSVLDAASAARAAEAVLGPPAARAGIRGIFGHPGAAGAGAALFTPTGEISCIYKQGGRARKIHLVIWCPTLEGAAKVSSALGALGNVRSDGRPILGLSARDAACAVLSADPEAVVFPAHVWTPWFSLFGSMSGFDDPEECFGDLTGEIRALETGLSSDPYMNRLVSRLDSYALVSSSDAHSPDKLGREATAVRGPLDARSLRGALRGGPELLGTVEFFPEEGKYHLDGHSGCGPAMTPEETRRNKGLCPVCGKPVTVGVLSRVMELADRQAPPEGLLKPDWHILPLRELLGQCLGRGPSTRAALEAEGRLLLEFGSEYEALLEAPLADLEAAGGPLLRLGIERMREGRVTVKGGYDGVFGTVEAVSAEDRREFGGGPAGIFAPSPRGRRPLRRDPAPAAVPAAPPAAAAAPAPVSHASAAPAGAPPPAAPAPAGEPAASPGACGLGLARLAAPAALRSGPSGEPAAAAAAASAGEAVSGDGAAGFRLAMPAQSIPLPPRQLRTSVSCHASLLGAADPAGALPSGAAGPAKETAENPGSAGNRPQADPAAEADRAPDGGPRADEGAGAAPGPAAPPPQAPSGPAEACRLRMPEGPFFSGLNEAQLGCATFAGDSLLVAAGPGSGKTRVLLARSLWLMERGLACPEETLLTTFTRKAAQTIGERLTEAGGGAAGARVGTLHSLALDFLRRGGEDPRLASEALLEEAAAEAVKGARVTARNLMLLVSRQKNLQLPLEFPDEETARAAAAYRGALSSLGLMDFDDLVLRAVRLAENGLRSGYRAVLADEAQDLSPLEYSFLKALAREASLTAIGDPAQSIYGFRGALPSLQDALKGDRPDLKVRSLTLNYRSTPLINAASELFRPRDGLSRASALAVRGRRIVRAQLDNPLSEAVYVARCIKEHLGGLLPGGSARSGGDAMEGLTLGDIAVIYRLRAQGQELLKTLLEEGIPCQISGDDGELAQDALDFKADKISLLTIHAAKGLEFRLVFVTGLDEGLCPFVPPSEAEEAPFDRSAEEERLFYVALTRARELLYLTRVRRRRIHGRILSGRPSPFWERIPAAVTRDVTARAVLTRRPAPLF